MRDNTITDAYLACEGLRDDPAQRRVVDMLAALQLELRERAGSFRRRLARLPLVPPPPPVTGLYLWGGVGRGKTFLMDLFFDTLGVAASRRIHFHRMMQDVHARLGRHVSARDPLELVAAELASDAEVLCFDEFFVSDIGDAMLLGRLLDGLFRRGVTLVATSNVAPSELYSGGLQRERFLPAIALLQKHTRVHELDGGRDYRLELLQAAGTYLSPAGDEANARLAKLFRDIAPGAVVERRVLSVNSRDFETVRCAKGVAWFAFGELCEAPRSQADYIEIARWYHTVIVSDVPHFGRHNDDAARRFIALVDEFYDRRVKLLVSAARPPGELYAGRRLRFEFERTSSRLTEMQSGEYLHSAHRA